MDRSVSSDFERFAEWFLRAYWETVKRNAFPMPPNEPVEETAEELLSDVSHETKFRPVSNSKVLGICSE
jgi:hypothetical protein